MLAGHQWLPRGSASGVSPAEQCRGQGQVSPTGTTAVVMTFQAAPDSHINVI